MNEGGNKDIALIGKAYQFGAEKGPDPTEAIKKRNEKGHPGEIRVALKRLACAEIDITRTPTAEDMARIFGKGGTKVTMAQMAAIMKFQQAMKNYKAMDTLIDHVDGKQIERKVEATVTLADLVTRSYELEDKADEPDRPGLSEDQTMAE